MGFSLYWLIPVLFCSWYVSREVFRRAESLGLVHLPNERSSHVESTPHGGGLGVVLVATLSGLLFFFDYIGVVFLLGSVLAALGLWDDIRSVPARFRFLLQSFVVLLLLLWLGALPPFDVLGVELGGWFFLLLVGIAGLWWINLFNFMDGIDGIASVQVLSVLLSSILIMLSSDGSRLEGSLIQVMLLLVAAVLGFLILNWPPARIFMGDVGSTWLAFMIFAFALLSVKQGWSDYPVWLILTALFVMDASFTLLTRLLNGQKFYEAHRSHAYQKLTRSYQQRLICSMSERAARASAHRKVSLLVLLVNGLWLLPLAWLSAIYPEWGIWLVFLAWLPLCMVVISMGAGRVNTI